MRTSYCRDWQNAFADCFIAGMRLYQGCAVADGFSDPVWIESISISVWYGINGIHKLWPFVN